MGINEICGEARVPIQSLPEGVVISSETQSNLDTVEERVEALRELSEVLTSLDELLSLRDEVLDSMQGLSTTAVYLYNETKAGIAAESGPLTDGGLIEDEVSIEAILQRMLTRLQSNDRELNQQYRRTGDDRQTDIEVVSRLLSRVREVYGRVRTELQSPSHPIARRVYNQEQGFYQRNFPSRSLTPLYQTLMTDFRQELGRDDAGLSSLDLNSRDSVQSTRERVNQTLRTSCGDYNAIIDTIPISPPPPVTPAPVTETEPEEQEPAAPPVEAASGSRSADQIVDYFLEGGVGAVFDFSQSAGWENWGSLMASLLLNLNIAEHSGIGLYFSTGGAMAYVEGLGAWGSRDSDIFGGANYFYHNGRSRLQIDAAILSSRKISVDEEGFYEGEERITVGQLGLGGSFLNDGIGLAGSFVFGNELGFSLRLSSLLRLGHNSRDEDRVVLGLNGDLTYLSGSPNGSGQVAAGVRLMPRLYRQLRAFIDFGWSYDFLRDESQGRLTFGLAVGDISSANTPVLGLER